MEKSVFYAHARPLFGGKLTQGQVEGMEQILDYAKKYEYPRAWLAYILATTFHETARWMQPIREGARRFGTEYSDASAKRAVASIHAKGIIRTNYALPDGPYKQSYYGRGLVQITWYANYHKFAKLLKAPLDKKPDLALEWRHALDILFIGLRDGMFTGTKLRSMLPTENATLKEYKEARRMVNGDVRKNGMKIAKEAQAFEVALTEAGY